MQNWPAPAWGFGQVFPIAKVPLENRWKSLFHKSGACLYQLKISTVKPVQNGHSQIDRKLVFKTNYRLMQVKGIAECSKGSILQYFWPSLNCHLALRSLFCLFLSGHFTQHLLYMKLLLRLSIRQVYVSFILVTRSIFDSKDRFIVFNIRFEVLLFKVLCIMHYDQLVT